MEAAADRECLRLDSDGTDEAEGRVCGGGGSRRV